MNANKNENNETNDQALDTMRRLKAAHSDADILSALKSKTTLALVKVSKDGTPYKNGATEDIDVRATCKAAGITSATEVRNFGTVEDEDDFDFDDAATVSSDVQPLVVLLHVDGKVHRIALTGKGTHMKDGYLFHSDISNAIISIGGNADSESCGYGQEDEALRLLNQHNVPFITACEGPKATTANMDERMTALKGGTDAQIIAKVADAGPAIAKAWTEWKANNLPIRHYGQKKTTAKATVLNWQNL
jgi:hypothetical protein